MITGTVTADREIVIQLDALSTNQSVVPIPAVVDTGFNGFLTLPTDIIESLGASIAGTRRAELGDGNIIELDIYSVTVQWHGEHREVLALQAGSTPLIGMSMLWGSRVQFNAQDAGAVEIDAVP
jgi:clan AA aspartic protease